MATLVSALSRFGRAAKNRFEVRILADLDDHLLSDIGLRRTDVRAALALPLHRDPSRWLKEVCCQGRTLMERARGAFAPSPAACC